MKEEHTLFQRMSFAMKHKKSGEKNCKKLSQKPQRQVHTKKNTQQYAVICFIICYYALEYVNTRHNRFKIN